MEAYEDEIIRAIIYNTYNNSIEEAQEKSEELFQYVDDIQSFLEQQIKKYEQLKGDNSEKSEFQVNSETGEVILDEGTLIHCASECSYEKLLSISDKGIIAGDVLGISESNYGETYFCADFYRADEQNNSTDVFKRIKESDSYFTRSPFSEQWKNCLKLAFIISPNADLKDLIDTDMYRKENINHVMQKMLYLTDDYTEEKRGLVSAIPYGVPSNFISGIVAGDYLLQSEEYMNVVQKLFPESYILTRQGKVFYNPTLSKEENDVKRKEVLENLQQFKERLICMGDSKIDNLLANAPKEMEEESIECQSVMFSEEEIGNAIKYVSIETKDSAQVRVHRDEKELQDIDKTI